MTRRLAVEEIGNDYGRRWFRLNGLDRGTGIEFDQDVFGLDWAGRVLDGDGCPLTPGDGIEIAVRRAIARLRAQ